MKPIIVEMEGAALPAAPAPAAPFGKTMVSLEDLGVLAATAQRNGTRDKFIGVALQWASEANAEIQRLRAAVAASAPAAPAVPATPGAEWRAEGEPDPHGDRYACERAALAMGKLTDDELANAVFLHGDGTHGRPHPLQIIAGTHFSPIAYLTAAKDRIRWLSRRLAEAQAAAAPAVPVAPLCKECGKALTYDEGEPMTRDHPGAQPRWICADCGV